ncbi:MAG: hypothetical protein DMF85_07150 [Acidobacteria bacterium]|nr:MAG: hypothetical protein DMF85_07150 [Acidobacteriota bacterium]
MDAPDVDTARAGDAAPSIAASTSRHRGSALARRKSGPASAALTSVPVAITRSSITTASSGRPLSDCARASSSRSSGSFAVPFCTARHERSWKVS